MRRLPAPVLGLLAFVTSAAVLIIEIVAARLLAPYVGVTLETYTAIIGTVLAGISAGAWLGGRVADKRNPLNAIPVVLIVGGALTLLSLPIIRLIGDGLDRVTNATVIGITAAAYLAPAIVLSMITPLLYKARVDNLENAGRAIGSLSALSTAGALLGSFSAGFVLVPRFRSRVIIGLIGGALIVLGALIALWRARDLKRGTSVSTASAVLLLGGLSGGGITAGSSWRDPCTLESSYFCASVYTPETKPSQRVLVLDDVLHSTVDLNDPTFLGFEYTRAFNVAIDAWRPEPTKLRALHIGGGGFTMPREIAATRPGSRNVVLELDPKLVRFDQKELGLKLSESIVARTGDARMGVRKAASRSYDLVIGDAFGGQSVPWHLTTKEFTADIARVLTDDGLYVLNVIDSPPLRFIKAELATVGRVFPHVGVISFPEALAGQYGANFVVVASRTPLAAAAIRSGLAAQPDLNMTLMDGAELRAFQGRAKVLTDELAPVAQLFTPS